MKFSGKNPHYMRNNLGQFGDDVYSPLNTGFIPLFSGSVFVSNIMEYDMDIFRTWAQEVIG